ncbi:hypothetical protein TI03_07405, partial [Achromatium sp. WMS1]
MDSNLQKIAEKAVRQSLLEYDRRHGYRGAEARIKPNASREVMDQLLARHPTIQGMEAAIVLRVGYKTAKLYLGANQTATLTQSGAYWAIRQRHRRLNSLL